MVGRRHGLAGPADAEAARAEPGERLRAGDLVDEVEVDREDRRGARVLGDDVVVQIFSTMVRGAWALISRALPEVSPDETDVRSGPRPLL